MQVRKIEDMPKSVRDNEREILGLHDDMWVVMTWDKRRWIAVESIYWGWRNNIVYPTHYCILPDKPLGDT